MGQTPWSAVINLSNSIIGVSVLAMPWCFKECGVVLAISLLTITGIVNKFSCNLLLRSSKATRKTSYETLAHHTLGGMGKLSVEVSVILLLMCTCIAFFVIIGDLGPSLVSKFAGIENTSNLRTFILLGTAIFIILPLAQKRNVESLSALSTISICFYFFFATSVFVDCIPRLISLEWVNNVSFWRPAGLLKGMSIFALSMCCQPTLFTIFNSLQERTPKMMEDVVSKGVNLVAFVYMTIGFFGYITYYTEGIKGDVLLNQPPSLVSDGLKLCFALSVALSFPLCVFPCRQSIFSLLCPNADCNPITGMTYIPPTLFRVITVVILAITLTIAILIPNVEVVLSLTGSTMGSLACFILPALIYQHTLGVPTRFMPKVLLIIGICFMLFSTYDNIRPAPQDPHIPAPVQVFEKLDNIAINKLDEAPIEKVADKQADGLADVVDKIGLQGDDIKKENDKALDVADIMAVDQGVKDTGDQSKEKDKGDEIKRQEPPIPHAPVEGAIPDTKDKAKEDVKEKNEGENEVQLEVPDKKVDKEEDAEEEAAPKEKHKKHKEKEAEGDRDERDLGDADDAKKDSKDKEIAEETEEKFKVQEEKQEKQEKKLEELQARQVIQERLIVKQAEEIDQLKKEHEQEKQNDDDVQNAAAQLAAQQAVGQVPQQPIVGGMQQQPVAAQQVPGGQQVIGQPIEGQIGDQQALGQLGVQQQPVAGQVPIQPVVQVAGQLPVVQQPAGQLPVAQQAVGQLPVAQQAAGQLPVVQQAAGQLPIVQQAAGQLPVVQQVPGQLAGQQQQLQGQFAQQQLAVGQQGVQVGMQPVAKMVSMFPQGAGGMGQNLAIQQQGGVVGGLQHAGVEGINQVAGIDGVPLQQQQQQQLMQGGVGQQGIQLDGAGMQAAVGGGGGALGQANIIQQANVPQQVPLALQQQQQFLQQPQQQLLQQPPQQQQLLQQQQILMQQQQPILVDQQQVPIQQQQVPIQQQQVPLQQNQQPALQILPDAADGLQGGVAMGQQPLQQQGMVPPGDGMANAGFVNRAQGGAVVDGGIPQQPQHVEPADNMIKSLDKDDVLEPGKDLNLAGVQQRVLNQAGADGEKDSEKQAKEQREDEKNGESDGVIQIVGEEKEEEEDEGKGGGDGNAVPNLEEAKGVAIEDERKAEDQDLLRIEDKRRDGDAERDNDGENENKEEDKEKERNDKAPEDESEHEVQIEKVEDKLLENHLKMVEDKEEEFADQEDVFDVKEKDEDGGKVEMDQEQNDLAKDKKKVRSREEV